MKALTIRQPWAEAIVAGHKEVENRSWKTAYRGLIAIHAGAQLSKRGMADPRITDTFGPDHVFQLGAILAIARLADCHLAEDGCGCSEWAETTYRNSADEIVTGVWHWVLTEIHQLDEPISMPGKLGLWTVTEAAAGRMLWLHDETCDHDEDPTETWIR